MDALRALSLPPGFGFHPTDAELIHHYLKRKILGQEIDREVIPEVDIYRHEPWDLPAHCCVPTRDSKWHFFASRDRKYPNGSRSKRATEAGYWKSTGKDRSVRYQNRVIGSKKTLVFHEGRPPCGKRTDWIMHEYYINENECRAAPAMKDAFVLCRVTKRNGWGMEAEAENVGETSASVQTDNAQSVQSEKLDEDSKKPIDTASSVMPEKSSTPTENVKPIDTASPVMPEKLSTPSENVEDYDAWFSELYDPSFGSIPDLGDVKNEPEDGVSSLALKREHINLQFLPAISDDFFPVPELSSDDMFSIDEFLLQSDAQSTDVFRELGTASMAPFGDQEGDIFADLNNAELASGDDRWPGIQRREREMKPISAVTNYGKCFLKASKMETRNGETVSGTIKVSKDIHVDAYDGEQGPAAVETDKITILKDTGAKKKKKRGCTMGLCDFFACCTSASRNCFIVFACVVGAAAVIFYFLLRDVRRLVTGFSALKL